MCRSDLTAETKSLHVGPSPNLKGVTPAVCRGIDGSGAFENKYTPAVRQISTINHPAIANRLTRHRLNSYLQATGGSEAAAIDLYDWNTLASAALHEDLGRLEVLVRNAMDEALVRLGSAKGWQDPWYRQKHLFQGRQSSQTRAVISDARRRATGRGQPEEHGKVIAALGFGFWRYLCGPQYLTSLWVPALASAFARHPPPNDPQQIRVDVNDRIQRLHFLRNRIAHHEPIHQRNLAGDHDQLLEVVGWICSDSRFWVAARSRTPAVLAARP